MSEFDQLLAGCRRREAGAFAALVARYLPLVKAVVRRQLSARLRSRFDSHDFAQDVWASFFQITLDRLDVPTEQALIAYLAKMAEVKVAEEGRHQYTRKGDIRRDLSLADVPEPAVAATPSQEVTAGDRWRQLTAALTPREREMLDMIRDGHTQEAVAARFQLTVKTVQRLLQKVRRTSPHGEDR
jgi:RNA polymerase sigma factor (sigma-70 family)